MAAAASFARNLDGWARNAAIGAEDTAITRLRAEQLVTLRAFIKPLASVDWHGFLFGKVAMRAGENGCRDD